MECASASDSDADSITLGVGGNCRGGYNEDEIDVDYESDMQPLRYNYINLWNYYNKCVYMYKIPQQSVCKAINSETNVLEGPSYSCSSGVLVGQ